MGLFLVRDIQGVRVWFSWLVLKMEVTYGSFTQDAYSSFFFSNQSHPGIQFINPILHVLCTTVLKDHILCTIWVRFVYIAIKCKKKMLHINNTVNYSSVIPIKTPNKSWIVKTILIYPWKESSGYVYRPQL